MKPELRKFYEKYSRINQLTSHGRRVFRRELARGWKEAHAMVYAVCQRYAGVRLTPEVADQVKGDLITAFGPPPPDPVQMIQSVTTDADGSANILLTPEFAAQINQF